MGGITARGCFNDQELTDIPVFNPGGWFGKAWLLEVGGSYWPLFLVVEAGCVQDAIDELADDGKYRHHIIVPDNDLGDYPEGERHYGHGGQVLDLDQLMIHGREGGGSGAPSAARPTGAGSVGAGSAS